MLQLILIINIMGIHSLKVKHCMKQCYRRHNWTLRQETGPAWSCTPRMHYSHWLQQLLITSRINHCSETALKEAVLSEVWYTGVLKMWRSRDRKDEFQICSRHLPDLYDLGAWTVRSPDWLETRVSSWISYACFLSTKLNFYVLIFFSELLAINNLSY